MALDLKMDSVLIQFDSLSVVDYINRISVNVVLEPIIGDCLSLFKSFQGVAIMFLNMSHN